MPHGPENRMYVGLNGLSNEDFLQLTGLHDEGGVPLRGLGVGSTRLLIAGLQRKAAAKSSVLLVDELEHGLEPHRIIRFLDSLGAKEESPPLQVFVSTHSPVALRELAGNQLTVLRITDGKHVATSVGTEDDAQSAIRLYPDAFLATSVLVCEGASEVGLIRGLDQYRAANGETAVSALGVALVDCGGGGPDSPFNRAAAFRRLGYRAAVLRDDDNPPSDEITRAFADIGGDAFSWRDGNALEDELFKSLSVNAVGKLVDFAVDVHGEDLIDQHIKSATDNAMNLATVRAEIVTGALSDETRTVLGTSARSRKNKWLKSISWMEEVAREIVAPDLPNAEADFRRIVNQVFTWTHNG